MSLEQAEKRGGVPVELRRPFAALYAEKKRESLHNTYTQPHQALSLNALSHFASQRGQADPRTAYLSDAKSVRSCVVSAGRLVAAESCPERATLGVCEPSADARRFATGFWCHLPRMITLKMEEAGTGREAQSVQRK